MGILGSLGSLASEVTSLAKDPGKLVADAANAVLPSNMKAVGDILGGITDIESGNPLAALSHLQDALKDLPQLMQALNGAAGGAANAAKPAGTAGAEPSPPQARSTSASTPTTTPSTTPPSTTSTSTPTPVTTASTIPAPVPARSTTPQKAPPTVTVTQQWGATTTKVDDGTNTTTVFEAANGSNVVRVVNDATGKVLGGYAGSASNISVAGEHVQIARFGNGKAVTTVDNGTNTAMVNQNGATTNISVGQDRPPAANPWLSLLASFGKPGTAAPTATAAGTTATTAAAASAPAASGGSTAAAAATGSTPSNASGSTASGSSSGATSASASSSSSAAPADLASLMALSPDQFMQAVTSGKIPPDVANDQSAMMQVQARMNQITQMNQLVTSMMAAAHQMQMSIIQNIRC